MSFCFCFCVGVEVMFHPLTNNILRIVFRSKELMRLLIRGTHFVVENNNWNEWHPGQVLGAFSAIFTGAVHGRNLKVFREEYDLIEEMCFESMVGGMIGNHMFPSHVLLNFVQRAIGRHEGGWGNARVGVGLRKFMRHSFVMFCFW